MFILHKKNIFPNFCRAISRCAVRSHFDLDRHKKNISYCCSKSVFTIKKTHSDLFGTESNLTLSPLKLRCKSYFCRSCAEIKKMNYHDRVKQGLKKETWRFVTLTTVNHYDDSQKNLLLIEEAWNRFRTLINKNDEHLKYVKVVEIGKNGMVHLHILINRYIPKVFLKYYWFRYTGAFKVDITLVQSYQNAVDYICKYLTKTFLNEGTNDLFFLTHKRRISFSNDYGNVPKKEKEYFAITSRSFDRESTEAILSFLILNFELPRECIELEKAPRLVRDFFEQRFFVDVSFNPVPDTNKHIEEIRDNFANLTIPLI